MPKGNADNYCHIIGMFLGVEIKNDSIFNYSGLEILIINTEFKKREKKI